MKSPKNYKQLLGIGMCFCLTFHGVAYGQMNFQPTIQENSGRWAASSNVLYQETRLAGPEELNSNGSPSGQDWPGNGSSTFGPSGADNTNPTTGPSGADNTNPTAGSPGADNTNPSFGPPGSDSANPSLNPPVSDNGVSSDGPGASDGGSMAGPGQTGVQPPFVQPDSLQPVGGGQNGAAALAEPEIQAEGAVLIDGATGKVLYGKNADQQFFPASITKIMTALLVLERCNLGDVVTFSSSATTNLESGAVSLNITAGDQLTVEQCLYGLLLKSANEIGNGLAEHVSGSVEAFAQLMNARARELGCTNTNFVNPHGLNNADHKTTPHDMALIMRAALGKADFCRIDTTCTYEFPAIQKEGTRTLTMGHKMMQPSDSRYYEGIVGGKTGYTSLAGNTLVTAVERNGVQLIVVVMKANQTHYTDTKALLDYGFANYGVLMGR
ncbi:serine hydrolase [Candidatus Ventrimonas sp. KK005]